MRCMLLILTALGVAGPASARLGETLAQCEERYGPVIEKRPAALAASDPEAAVFSKAAVTILVEFHGGVAWHISFRKTLIAPVEVEALLEANAGQGSWSTPLRTGVTEQRLSGDKMRIALIEWQRKDQAREVSVLSREFIKSHRAQQLKRAENLTNKSVKQGVNPLPGF